MPQKPKHMTDLEALLNKKLFRKMQKSKTGEEHFGFNSSD